MIRTALTYLGFIVLLSVSSGNSLYAAGPIIPAPPQISAESYLLLDATTGKVIVEKNSEQRLPPASLTKIMASYVVANELKRGSISLDDMVPISVTAWRMGGSKMFIQEGTKVKLFDLVRGVVIQSGNDATVALAEHIAGSEDSFADIMNQQAERLGMTNTNFVNATGWPDENHYTTASDLAKLTVALINDFPEHYELYKEKYFTYNDIRQPNRNSLLWRDDSVDGVKTGHTEAAGYCLVASALRDDMRLVSVVMKTDSQEARARETRKLLTYGYRYYETVPLYAADESLKTVRLWGGSQDTVNLGVKDDVVITLPRGERENLSAKMDINSVIRAPVDEGKALGELTVTLEDEILFKGPLLSVHNVSEAGFFARLWDSIYLFFLQLFGGDALAL
ncbi:MAG: D-alanyl-D-alanine carboxypeptidase family protein [Pseudomonadales bacterium]